MTTYQIEDELEDILGRDDWTVIVLYDAGDLICTLTRTCVTLQLYGAVDSRIPYQNTEELLDAETMCNRIEEEGGLVLEPDDWLRLLDSASIHHFRGDSPEEVNLRSDLEEKFMMNRADTRLR